MTTPGNVIGIDLGGTQLRAALVDPMGQVLRLERVATDRAGGPAAVVAQIEALVAAVRDQGTRGIGIGIPGAFDGPAGTVLGIPALPGWNGVPLAAMLLERTGIACRLENDANVAALGEWHAGAGKGCAHFVYVTISTGIGAGVIVDGRLLRGFGGNAGEAGHTRISDDPAICSCGQTGCWEAVASGTALGRRARAAAQAEPDGAIARLAAGAVPGAQHVGEAARAGDAAALAILREEAFYLGAGFVNLQHLYGPQRIVFGGGVSALLGLMQDEIATVMAARRLPGFAAIPVMPAALGDMAGVVGAAGLFAD